MNVYFPTSFYPTSVAPTAPPRDLSFKRLGFSQGLLRASSDPSSFADPLSLDLLPLHRKGPAPAIISLSPRLTPSAFLSIMVFPGISRGFGVSSVSLAFPGIMPRPIEISLVFFSYALDNPLLASLYDFFLPSYGVPHINFGLFSRSRKVPTTLQFTRA